jgi:tetratricopeptide (TPR) repeat protein/predicted Ser/Thr protein kinase
VTGTRIQHYQVGPLLGAGGMGAVYRAEDLRLGRHVALKFLAAPDADAEQRARLVREARAASILSSPHIAAIYDIGEHEGQVFIVMEYVDGESLAARIARGPLGVREAVDVAARIADALDEAHERGIVHRDIKSANVMIDARGRVKVLDFGLARFLPAGAGPARVDLTAPHAFETAAGTLLGTVSYMSPEQALGRPVDRRSDLFSTGIVLYEMLAGRLPFEGATALEVIDRILHQEPPALARFNYEVTPALEHIVIKALAKDPDFRYQSARELYIDLRAVRRALDAPRSTPAAAADRHVSGLSRVEAGAGRAAAAAAAPAARVVAVMPFSNITREPADEWIGPGIAETVTADLQALPGLAVVGRARMYDAVRNLSSGTLGEFEERLGIEIGRRLGATWIVGGGYQRMGDRIRITAELLDVATGHLLRTVKVDGRIEEIFALQDRIVYELGQGLDLALGPAEMAGIGRDETTSLEAYEAYSRGLMNLRMATRESLDHALAQFERATSLDPGYARAWAALGQARSLKGEFLSMPGFVEQAIEALARAIELDAGLAHAHASLGQAHLVLGRHDEAIAAIREAIRLDPANASAHAALARAHWFGRGEIDEGIAALERAAELNPDGGYTFLQLALLYALKGRYDEAEAAARKAVDLQEQYLSGTEGLQIVGAHLRLGYVFYRRGRYREAIREYERELAFLGSGDHALRERTLIETELKLSAAYWRLGDQAAADRFFERAVRAFKGRQARGADDPATTYYVAAAHALRGDAAKAVRHLEASFARLRALNRARAGLDPDFDPVRGDPGFQALVSSDPGAGPPAPA